MAMNKRTLKIAGIVVAVIVVILIAIPFFINVETFRPKIESELSSALGREVKLGKLSLSVFSGSVSVDDISISDDPAFSKTPFVTAKSLKIGVELGALIFSKQLKVTGIKLQQPEINLLSSANGTWNFSSLGASTTAKGNEPSSSTSTQGLSIAKLEINDGKLTVGKVNSSAKPQVFDKLNAEVTNFSPTTQFPFELSVNLPGGGDAKLNGKAGPINPQDASKTPFEAKIKVNKLDLAASGFVDASTGIAGLMQLDGTVNSNGTQAKASGNVTLDKLKLSPKGTPAPKDVTLQYALTSNLAQQSGTITQGDIALGKATAKLTGGYQTQGAIQIVNLKLNAPNMSVDELQTFLPAMGVTLPSGSSLKGGTLSADLTINGPLDKLVIAGPVKLSNTTLAGFSASNKLSALSAFGGKVPSSSDTVIQNASLNAHVAPDMTRLDAISLNASSLGDVTGAGTISPAGALDFQMKADLKATGAVSQQVGLGSGGPIPFKIQGTSSNPSFVPDAGAMATNAAKSAIQKQLGDKTGGFTSMFGKKKPK